MFLLILVLHFVLMLHSHASFLLLVSLDPTAVGPPAILILFLLILMLHFALMLHFMLLFILMLHFCFWSHQTQRQWGYRESDSISYNRPLSAPPHTGLSLIRPNGSGATASLILFRTTAPFLLLPTQGLVQASSDPTAVGLLASLMMKRKKRRKRRAQVSAAAAVDGQRVAVVVRAVVVVVVVVGVMMWRG